jgi:uncharacterized membrane protein YbhN (UPF0104 family)
LNLNSKIRVVTYIAIVIFLVGFVCFNWRHVFSLLVLSPYKIALVSLAISFNTVLRGGTNYCLYRRLGGSVTLIESIGLAVMNTIGNMLPLSGGLVAKGAYLKRIHKLNLTCYFSATLAVILFQTSLSGLIAIGSILSICYVENTAPHYGLLAALLIMSASICVFAIPYERAHTQKWISKWLASIREGWGTVKGDTGLLIQLMLLHAANIGVEALRFMIVFSLFSTPIFYASAVLFSATGILTRFVNIAPSGIGVRESIIGGLSITLGLDLRIAVIVVIFDRFLEIVITLIAALPLSRLVMMTVETSQNAP